MLHGQIGFLHSIQMSIKFDLSPVITDWEKEEPDFSLTEWAYDPIVFGNAGA